MKKNTDKNSPIDFRVANLASEFDSHFEAKDIDSILKTIDNAKELSKQKLNECSEAQLNYSIATSYFDLLSLGYNLNSSEYLEENTENQLFFYRKAIDIVDKFNPNKTEIPYIAGIARQLYTNYGNLLRTIGRPIEALRVYSLALLVDPQFAMAQGNMGVTYFHYAESVSDTGHQQLFLYASYKYLKMALSNNKTLPNNARIGIEKYLSRFSESLKKEFLDEELKLNEYSLGANDEQDYRKWCLSNHLFLNSMNDLPFIESFIAADAIQLPNIVRKASDGLDYKLHGIFNQIKQEFIVARFLFYESQEIGDSVHFADKETYLLNSPDYPNYSIRVEKVKLAFRSLFSIFDKVAFFINEYFELGIPRNKIYFSRLWNEKKTQKLISNNKIFQGIYWISKEFCFKKFGNFINPQAKRINEVRNSLEHKYTKVVLYDNISSEYDTLADYITYDELLTMTKYLMGIVRETIIYLILSININEKQLHAVKDNIVIPPINLWIYDDEWKI